LPEKLKIRCRILRVYILREWRRLIVDVKRLVK
jgi:hypothetical protein